ncbi:MAG: radical SAM protein [Candidatus Kaelpia aquatica]|nr:radical SAM protein [Candidatus Kaelpia aquatica]
MIVAFVSSPAIRKNFPGKYFRLRSPQCIIEEIETETGRFWNKGFRCIDFVDDNFGLDIDWFYEFCSLYKKSWLYKKIKWFCHIRADKMTNQWAKLASEAGCIMVGIGVESGDEDIRSRVYNKKITNKNIEKALDYLKRYSIASLIYMIIGCYEETEYTVRKSVWYIKKLSPSVTHFFNFQPFPETKLAQDIQNRIGLKDGIKLMEFWNSKKMNYCIWVLNYCAKWQLEYSERIW